MEISLICQGCGKRTPPMFFDTKKELCWGGRISGTRLKRAYCKIADTNGWSWVRGKPYCPDCLSKKNPDLSKN